jgi:hypothetical protein
MNEPKFDAAPALATLKRFQRKTVDYVFDRLYGGENPSRQFLVADEVGLGKTMIARGVIAKAIEHLWDVTERIDILYICSNQAIAAQNINRLNVLRQEDSKNGPRLTRASRLNLIPLEVGDDGGLSKNKVNFISLTPATTFEPGMSTGIVRERAFLFFLLEGIAPPGTGLRNLLQASVGFERWNTQIEKISETKDNIDLTTVEKFRESIRADRSILEELVEVCGLFGRRRESYPREMRARRNRLVGSLRAKLSRVCVDSLQPDLIILDEFQRYTTLLYPKDDPDEISEAAELAQQLFNYSEGPGRAARTLLLSATPYKMLTLKSDADDTGEHYEEFLKTVSFLFGADQGPKIVATLQKEMAAFCRFLQDIPAALPEAIASRERIERTLRQVISRAERVDSTSDRNSMIREVPLYVTPDAADLRQAIAVSAVAKALEAPNIVEYWKSSPYLLNFMRDYKLKTTLADRIRRPTAELRKALNAAIPMMLTEASVRNGACIDPGNGRMRALMQEVFGDGLERRLWIPASMPYYGVCPWGPTAWQGRTKPGRWTSSTTSSRRAERYACWRSSISTRAMCRCSIRDSATGVKMWFVPWKGPAREPAIRRRSASISAPSSSRANSICGHTRMASRWTSADLASRPTMPSSRRLTGASGWSV